MSHNCKAYWGTPAQMLVALFDELTLDRGAACFMAQSTYCSLLVVQREIELAAGDWNVPPTDPLPWWGDTGLCPADTQARIRHLAQGVAAGLSADLWAAAPPPNHWTAAWPPLGVPGWMTQGAGPDVTPPTTASTILGVSLAPFGSIGGGAPAPGLMGKVKAALGS